MKKIMNTCRTYILLTLLLIGSSVYAQDKVSGRVFDLATRQGFAGVRISVADTKLTVMSESDGTFTIEVPSADVTFLVDAPGYQSQVVALKGRSALDIYLLQQTSSATFYDGMEFSTQSPVGISDFSVNALTIDEDFARMNGRIRALAHSGMPANGSAVFMRGYHSLNASSQPLYVVDGVVWQEYDNTSVNAGSYRNPLSVIDPNDIEKITLLKGGSSIYGSKGANGVILIDTKRSHSPATTVAVDLGAGYRLPFQSIPMLNAAEYRIYASDILGSRYEHVSAVEKYKFLDDDVNKSYYNANHNATDWLKLVNEAAWSQNYGIRVQGGDDVALYAVSVGYTNSNGNVPNSGFDRLNFRVNSDISMTKALKFAFDVAFTQTNSKARNDGVDSVSSPTYLALTKSPLYDPYEFDNRGNRSSRLSNYDELGVGNPLALTEYGIGLSKQYALNTSILPTYTFCNDKLKASLLFSYAWWKMSENQFIPDKGVIERPLLNAYGEVYGISQNFVQDRADTHTSIIIDGRINWKALQNETHRLNAFGGYRFYSDNYLSRLMTGHNTGSDNVPQLANTVEALRATDGIDDSWRSMSWYANADYSYKNKYLLNLSAATDLSSRFGKEAGWGFFPSVSAGWIISSEKFMKNADFVNFLKLTASYGITGSDDIPNYASKTYFSSINYSSQFNGLVLSNIGNPKLQWETTGTTTAGLDFSLFDNRWTMKMEVYSSKTKDLLTQKQLNEVAGLKYYWSNDGEMQNTGWETSADVRILNGRYFKLDFGASIGHYKNKITSLANGSFITEVAGAQILTQEGQAAGVFYGYKTAGVFSSKDEAAAAGLSLRNRSGELIPFEAGDMRFEEVVKDGLIDEKDRQIIGDPNPDFYGNFNFSLSWKKFTLGALFTYSCGNDVYNALRANLEAGKTTENQSVAMQNRWIANGQRTNIPRAVYGDPMGNARFSDRWIEDGSYLRLKSLSLSYKLPILSDFIQEITIYGTINNLFTWTKYMGADPEFAYGNSILYQGIDAGLIPQTRSFNFGIKINL